MRIGKVANQIIYLKEHLDKEETIFMGGIAIKLFQISCTNSSRCVIINIHTLNHNFYIGHQFLL